MPAANGVARLINSPASWIHRRVERVDYVDLTTIRRHTSVDFTVPHLQPFAGGRLYLPIAVLDKRPLVGFDLHDAQGRPLPMLTAEQNGRISFEVLLAVAGLLADPQQIPEERLAEIAAAESRELAKPAIADVLVKLEGEQRARLERAQEEETDAPVPSDARQWERQIQAFQDLMYLFAANFVLYCPAATTDIGARRIVKYAFDGGKPFAPGFAVRIGWKRPTEAFEVPLAPYSHSYHFEYRAPPEMAAYKIAIYDGTVSNASAEITDASSETVGAAAHLNVKLKRRILPGVAVEVGVADTETIRVATILAALTLGSLLLVLSRLCQLVSDSGANAVVPVLLAVPGLLLGYVTRPSAHPIVARYLAWLRYLAGCSSLAAFAGAIALAVGLSLTTLCIVFWTSTGVAAVALVGLSVAWVRLRATP